MTQLALIPPIPHLRRFNTTGVSLLLAQLFSWPEYVQFYKERGLIGEYLILDNGAYELGGSLITMSQSLTLGISVAARELVAPDSIMNEVQTLARTLDAVAFMNSNVGQMGWTLAGKPRIMVVPQVHPEFQDIDDYDRHARELLDLWHYGAPYLKGHITLGVAKNFANLHGGWLMLFRECIGLLGKDYPIEVHCLGLPKSMPMLRKLLRDNPNIRSIDTALPFVSAIHGIDLSTVGDEEIPKRPECYLTCEMRDEAIELAQSNIQFMQEEFASAGS